MSPARASAGEDRLHRPGTSAFRRLNLAMGMAGLAAFGILYTTQPLLPDLSRDFAISPGTASLSVSASTGALALTVIPATSLALRWGRVRSMRAALLAAVALTMLAAVAPTYDVLVVLRALAGVALAGVIAVAMGHVGAEVHPMGLGTAMGLYVAGNSLGGVSGRVVGSVVVDLAGWRWASAAVGLGALAATVAFWRLLPEPVAPDRQPHRHGEVAPHAFRTLLRDPRVWAMATVPFVLMGSFVAVYNYLTFRLATAPFGLPSAVVGLVFLTYLAGTLSSALAGRLADRLGRPLVLGASTLVMAAGVAIMVPDRIVTVVLGLVVLTVGFFGAHATASGWAPVVAGDFASQGSALYVFAYYLGSSVFGAVLGLAWSGAGWPGVSLGVGALVLVGLVAGALVGVRRPGTRSQTSNEPPVRQ